VLFAVAELFVTLDRVLLLRPGYACNDVKSSLLVWSHYIIELSGVYVCLLMTLHALSVEESEQMYM